ncbi:hypothetical protein [Lysinibacillus sp. NPDC093692]|uniref:hypothetical protein n=1 Tax=Lysinibacillus sp. NPDC093692 TaxID=3390578 RepID=UPI003D084242
MLRPADVFCAKAQRQQHVFVCATAQRQQQHEGRHDVGHFGNATGRGVLRLSSSTLANVWTSAERS